MADMTREEAIDELSVIYERLLHPEDCEQGVYSFRDGDYLEALDKAIEALEQEPCKDAISFEDLEECKELMTDVNGDTVYAVKMSEIRQLPPVNPQESLDKTQMIDKSNFSQEQYKADLECAFDCGRASVEPCDDAISRQAVLDTLMKCEEPCDDRQDFYLDSTTEFEEKIKELPPVTPKPKTGHWINIDDIESECSECGHREPNERFIFEDINFCAKCGAKMFEQKESEGEK